MLHDHAPTPLSSAKPYIITAMNDLSSYERITLSLLIGLSLAMVLLLVGEARVSVASLKRKSGRHPMLSVLPIDELTKVVAEFKAEPTRAGRMLIVLDLADLARPFVYLGVVGLGICGYVFHFFMKDPPLSARSEFKGGDM